MKKEAIQKFREAAECFMAGLDLLDEKKPVTLQEVRAFLADISRNGKTDEMKALLGQFGAEKLSDVPQEKYEELLAAARGICNA